VTIPKKGDILNCSNYRTISLISHSSEILLLIIPNRLRAQLEMYLSEEQAGYRANRSTVQQILTLRLIAENAREYNQSVHNFIDFKKAFDSVWHKGLCAVLKSFGVSYKIVPLLQTLYVLVDGSLIRWFQMTVGNRQGVLYRQTHFFLHFWNASWMGLNKLCKDSGSLCTYGMCINKDKTKAMAFRRSVHSDELTLLIQNIYLGITISWNNDCILDIIKRIQLATVVYAGFRTIWKDKNITVDIKLNLLTTCVFSVLYMLLIRGQLKKKT